MIFGAVPVAEAQGAILAHSLRLESGKLPKGHLIGPEDLVALRGENVTTVIAARLEPGDMMEDEAAQALADAVGGDHLRFSPAATGRVNIYATANGLFVADRSVVDRFNAVDPAITLACLADHVAVFAGDMIATIKIIPLAVPGTKVSAARAVIKDRPAFVVKPFESRDVSLVATRLSSLKASVMDKTARVLEQRLAPSGSRIVGEERVAHDAAAVGDAITRALAAPAERERMIVIFGASAVCDDEDVIPAAIRLAGGHVEQVGLPVDPGNLLVLGSVGDVPVIGAPGCARSPKENGFDWVLNRILAGETPTARELTGLGVGGLLMEIPSRPMPRASVEDQPAATRIGIVLLAAGRASRMGEGGRHKLLAEFDGQPLARLSAEKALGSTADAVVVVTGYRADEIAASLSGLGVPLVHNPDYASGMSASLRAGLSAAEIRDMDGVLVMLADMPAIAVNDLNRLIAAFRGAGGAAIVRAVADGKRGNPVVLPRSTFAAIMKLEGDVGARAIIEGAGLDVLDVEIGAGAHLDVDTPEAILAAGGILKD